MNGEDTGAVIRGEDLPDYALICENFGRISRKEDIWNRIAGQLSLNTDFVDAGCGNDRSFYKKEGAIIGNDSFNPKL